MKQISTYHPGQDAIGEYVRFNSRQAECQPQKTGELVPDVGRHPNVCEERHRPAHVHDGRAHLGTRTQCNMSRYSGM